MTAKFKEDRGPGLAKWLWLLLRPADWLPYLGLTLLGWSETATLSTLWIVLAWSVLYLAGGYGFNGVCDWRTDSTAKNPIRDSGISRGFAAMISLTLLLSSGPLALVKLSEVKWPASLMVALGIVYSLPRWGLKRVPGIVSLANLALFVPLYWIGAARVPGSVGIDLWILGVLALPSLQSQLVHERSDIGEDREAHVRTTAIWLGEPLTRRSVQVLGILTGVVAALARHRGLLGAGSAGLFVAAGIVSAIKPGDSPAGKWPWRRRIKVAYLLPCTAWLIERLVLNGFGR